MGFGSILVESCFREQERFGGTWVWDPCYLALLNDYHLSGAVLGTAEGSRDFITMTFSNWIKGPREKKRPIFLLFAYKGHLEVFKFDSITQWLMYACGEKVFWILG